MATPVLPPVVISRLIPAEIMARAARGIAYVGHPTRLKILEYLDVHPHASVSAIAGALALDQAVVSQHLKKMRDAALVYTTRRGIFVYYDIGAEYPASIFVCLRKLFGYMTDQRRFLCAEHREMLPDDYVTMAANRIKLFAHVDKMRILEYLTYHGAACVCEIMDVLDAPQTKVSQHLKKLYDDGFVTSRRAGRFVYYDITPGVHKTTIGCIHKRYDRVGADF